VTRFEGRSCLVTGSTGMAAAAATALATEGARVFVASRTEEHARDLAARIADAGGTAAWRTSDLSVEDEASSVVEACVEAFGRLDAVYHVAGISARRHGDGPLHEASLGGWHAALENNLTSLFLVARAAVRQMLSQEPDADGARGVLLAMSSALAGHPAPDHFATHGYAASKGGIEAFVRAVAATYAARGIRVNAIAPALVATPMSRRAQEDPAILAYLREKQPLAGGPMETHAVTPVALHLLSRDARMVTGQVIAVDAGWSVSEPSRIPPG
jgi:NAD(P)-dependent dehydrogenase (short-subunit alcohol dehydrogenase family)